MANARGQKRDLERKRLERAAAKRARRQGAGSSEPADVVDETEARPPSKYAGYSEQQILEALADLHARFAAEEIDHDELEATRTELLQQLTVT